MSYHLPNIESHESMKWIIEEIRELYPIGSMWYSRIGDTIKEVENYEDGGIVFRDTATTTTISGKRVNDRSIYDYECLLNGRLIRIDEMIEDVKEYCLV